MNEPIKIRKYLPFRPVKLSPENLKQFNDAFVEETAELRVVKHITGNYIVYRGVDTKMDSIKRSITVLSPEDYQLIKKGDKEVKRDNYEPVAIKPSGKVVLLNEMRQKARDRPKTPIPIFKVEEITDLGGD